MRVRFILRAVFCVVSTVSILLPAGGYGASLWSGSIVPATVDSGPDSAVELGVKFRADSSGTVSGIRFYKAGTNVSTHVGNLWTENGNQLASATFSGETASGWQQVSFPTPVAINANTVYIASYHTNSGHYSCDQNFFLGKGIDSPPLHALADGVSGYNGVFAYGSASSFPSKGWRSSNYWVDVVFNSTASSSDTVAPTVTAFTVPATSPTLTVPISAFSATDNVGVTGYLVNESAAKPSPTASGWTTGVPASYSFATAGSKTLYAWAKDANGNVSAGMSDSVIITLVSGEPLASDKPILIISSNANPFSDYYAEILLTEGLNAFDESDISLLSTAQLADYDVVILGEMSLTTSQVTTLNNWVNGGGRLIAMRPDKKLAGLLGLSDLGTTVSDAYLRVNPQSAPGSGIVSQAIQYHGMADIYGLTGAASIATLYANATTATSNPAVTLRTVGTNGGQAAAFAYDLARSVVYTRQGNPDWAGQERDGYPPIRSDDLFYGNASFDPNPDWVDQSRIEIPQADEQQRLLANLIIRMNIDKKPLPRFWYFPRNLPAVVVMTGDDHGNGGTAGRFDNYAAMSPSGCSVAEWECIRGTSYLFTSTPLSNSQASAYNSAGFELAPHVSTDCSDWNPSTLQSYFSNQVSAWKQKYTGLPSPVSHRTHCVVWSDYATQPQVELSFGMRLDTNYYYWPPEWVTSIAGLFTGSGMPMRFVDLDGSLIDVYQGTTQMTDESGQAFPATIDALLDNAIGPEGFYGAFVANMHNDTDDSAGSNAIVASAQARGIPVVSVRQLLTWLDGRNASKFDSFARSSNRFDFSVSVGNGANGLMVMLPLADNQTVSRITNNGSSVPFFRSEVKGIDYVRFAAANGSYQVTYTSTGDTTAPTVTGFTIPPTATSLVVPIISFTASDNVSVTGYLVNESALVPSVSDSGWAASAPTSYSFATAGSKTLYAWARDAGGNVSPGRSDSVTITLSSQGGGVGEYSIWPDSEVPGVVDSGPDSAVEIGVKFRSDIDGTITGIRFYKASTNSGSHVASLWTGSGALLASAAFINETASGWQRVNFSTPVAISADEIYVASYHTNTGHYSFNRSYFSSSGVDSPPLHALADGGSGPNGVFAYGSGSSFPGQGWNGSNYWVDVVFSGPTSTDGVSPTVTDFITPGTATTLTVPVTSLIATDNVAVTGYLVNESAVKPSPAATGWSASVPTAYTFASAGSKVLYAWAKDASGNVSAGRSAAVVITLQSGGAETGSWYAGDMHVHRSCGGSPEAVTSLYEKMLPNSLSVISLLADMGNGEVQNPVTDLPLVNGGDAAISAPGRILHWDAEWHWDATYGQYAHQALGGHVLALGLGEAQQVWEEYTYPVLNRARQQNAITGFAHMQYLNNDIPQGLDCCTPLEYPVEIALGSAQFVSEDVEGSDNAMLAYYRLLNCGFRPGLAAGTDYPCNGGADLGSLLTYVQVPGDQMTYRNWIDGIAAGRTVVSRNGQNEFLDLKVNGSATPGDEIKLSGSGAAEVMIQWTANRNLNGTIELVHNGEVVAAKSASAAAGSPASLIATVNFTKSGWLAARRMGGNGHQLHTAAVFVTVDNAPVRASAQDAQFYVQWIDNLLTKTSAGGAWSSYFVTSGSAAHERYQAARALYQQIALEAGAVVTPPQPPPPQPTPQDGTILTSQTPGIYENDAYYELGTRFRADVNGQITQVRLYTNAQEGGVHTVRIWRVSDRSIVTGPHSWDIQSGSYGWKTFTLPAPVSIGADTDYIVAVSNSSDRYYAAQLSGFAAPIVNGHLHTYSGSGVYSTVQGSMPTSTWNNSNYFRDVVFTPSN